LSLQRAGKFNVPFGRHGRPYFPRAEMRRFAIFLQHATVCRADFRTTLAQAGPDDLVYCDPPYSPASATARFAAYAPGGFTTSDHAALVTLASEAARRGAYVIMSNHDTPSTRCLYRNASRLDSFTVTRTISCRGANRRPAPELLVCYAPCPHAKL
jgi:DNA adenine methylase